MTVLAGFSGGADSTALLQLLWEYGKERGVSVRAVHVNHGIRGEEALRDQAFCAGFCQERGIPFEAVQADVPALAAAEKISLEEAGRRARYQIFDRYYREGAVQRVALAHHRNDQAETMLFRLMRGTGLRGLRGMEPVRLPYVRPLLCVTRPEIESWLLAQGIAWVEDATNQELTYARNQIRHQVLAPMERMRPGTVEHMAETARQLGEVEDFLEAAVAEAMETYVTRKGGTFRIRLEAFSELHPAVCKPLVLHCMEELPGGISHLEAVHAEQVCALADAQTGSRITLPENICAVKDYRELVIQRGYGTSEERAEVFCQPGETYRFLGRNFSFSLEEPDKSGEIPVNRCTKWFDYDKIKNKLVLRTRRPGDYLANARGSHKKLKDYLIDCKIPREERDRLILLADGSHILWVAGMRISADYKVTDQTRRILKVHMTERGGTEDGETSH